MLLQTALLNELAMNNFLLDVEPNDKIVFAGDTSKEIKITLKLTNKSDFRQAFKVKCSNNDLFRIRPATGIIEYGKSFPVEVTFRCPKDHKPVSDKHHFGIYHIPAPEGATCTGAWAEHYGPPQGERRLKVYFTPILEQISKSNASEDTASK